MSVLFCVFLFTLYWGCIYWVCPFLCLCISLYWVFIRKAFPYIDFLSPSGKGGKGSKA
uniref:Transmembrane protein n=1 Tax=Picea sitchensis TaxID=3332 RepID=A0A6B9XT76_PICSI|nr:hypothetical protein Q903MT_gene4256 [Picea sitchensis]